jgi:hypothetical protein
MRKLALLVALLCACPAWATLAIDATSLSGSTPAISGTSFSWSHTVTSSGSNRLLMVFVASVTSTQTCTGVTYNGVAMNGPVIDIRDNGSSELRNYVFWMVNPTTGANTVAVTYSAALDSGNFAAAMAISFTGANQTYPFRYPAVNWSGPQGLATTVASNVTDAVSGDIIIGSAVTHASTITQGANNTAINTWSAFNFATNTSWATASVAASVATQLTWGQSPAGVYSVVEIAVRPDTDTTSIPFIDHFVGQGFGTQNTIPYHNAVTTATIAGFAVGSCSNALLFVEVEYWTGTTHATATVSGVTFNTTSNLSLVGTKRQSDSSGNIVVEFWALKAPPNTSASIVATFSASIGGGIMGATSWCNVDQTTPFGTVATAGSAGAAVSTTVVSTATSYVIDGATVDFTAGDKFLPTGAMEWDFNSGSTFDTYGMSQVKKGAASVTMNYTGTTTDAFAAAGVGINGLASAGGTVRHRAWVIQ